MYEPINKNAERLRRKATIRKKVHGTSNRPRLAVFKSLKHIAVQIINDDEGKTLVMVSSKNEGLKGKNIQVAEKVGTIIGQRALEAGIKQVVFDRSGYIYHGKVKALADSARKTGLEF
ncbi:MAG TPA: 50S ribosomal protein L18 [Caldisericia bacterium]|jgi:large subunit ribosomal protein L18|nr:50S ribosomal protein L18 [Caldisericales bacterium]HOR46901.1 50S ribosomal protein L18 [Caldisericia bacterium]HOU07426.1 50S ribosomal protein L18 [Caldisericia bacterium]HPL90256.1 50S ribosomal protein L18 [Caldisericia bacterium]HQG59317.1 50S ribosomal protein L18 [Caldisericia bacterium]